MSIVTEGFRVISSYLPVNHKPIQKDNQVVEKISLIEHEINLTLSGDVKEYFLNLSAYLPEYELALFYGFDVFNINAAVKERKEHLESSLALQNLQIVTEIVPNNSASADFFNKKWLPIAHDYSGNYLAFDFSPGEAGEFGQIINVGSRETTRYVLFKSISDFFNSLLENLKLGKARIEIQGVVIRVILNDYEDYHLMDAVHDFGIQIFKSN